jgi:hypothetical protein
MAHLVHQRDRRLRLRVHPAGHEPTVAVQHAPLDTLDDIIRMRSNVDKARDRAEVFLDSWFNSTFRVMTKALHWAHVQYELPLDPAHPAVVAFVNEQMIRLQRIERNIKKAYIERHKRSDLLAGVHYLDEAIDMFDVFVKGVGPV